MLTHKDRYLKAIHLEVPDMVPVDGTNLDLIHAQVILRKTPMTTSLFLSNQYNDELDMNHIIKHNQRLINEASMKFDFDSLMVNDWHLYPDGFKPKFIDENSYADHLGRIYRIKKDVKTTYWVDGRIKSPEDLDNFEFPNPEEINFDMVEETIKQANNEYSVIAMCHSVVTAPFEMRGE